MRKPRIMIFDDEELILSLFRDFFPPEEYEVLAFRDPVVCPIYDHRTDSCPALSPCADALITDYRMPGMNGLQLLEKQVRMGCALPIRNKAVMSGHCDDTVQSELAKGCSVFFQKPLRFSTLRQWLRECVERSDLSKPLPPLRKEARRPTSLEQTRLIVQDKKLLKGTPINVSDSGLCLELGAPLARDQQVCVDSGFVHPSRSATVRWVQQREDGSYVVGLHYC